MTILKALGIAIFTPKIILLTVTTLTLLGVVSNCLFELWKLVPTLFISSQTPEWQTLSLYSLPVIVFLFLVWWAYRVHTRYVGSLAPTSRLSEVPPHPGVILAMSYPQKVTPKDIITQISAAADPTALFAIPSLGHAFRTLYHHASRLKHVWPLTTKDSKPFLYCLEAFIIKFIKYDHVIIHDDYCYLGDAKGNEHIENAKKAITAIYSRDNLESLPLSPQDVIVDVTGGSKDTSIGMAFGAIDSDIKIQYIEQKDFKIIPLNISPEILLDKMGNYLIELYTRRQFT